MPEILKPLGTAENLQEAVLHNLDVLSVLAIEHMSRTSKGEEYHDPDLKVALDCQKLAIALIQKSASKNEPPDLEKELSE